MPELPPPDPRNRQITKADLEELRQIIDRRRTGQISAFAALIAAVAQLLAAATALAIHWIDRAIK